MLKTERLMRVEVLHLAGKKSLFRQRRCGKLAERLRKEGYEVNVTACIGFQADKSPLKTPILMAGAGGIVFRDLGNTPESSWWTLEMPPPGKVTGIIALGDNGKYAKKYATALVPSNALSEDEMVGMFEVVAAKVTQAQKQMDAREAKILAGG